MNREYHKWWSPRLRRDMELLVFGHAGAKVLVFPTRDGRFYEYEDLRITEELRSKIDAGQLQLFCVDSVDSESFYCFWAHPSGRMQRHIEYEEYILNEVMPFMQQKNDHPCTIAHGCSLGAFMAANIAFRYPQFFQKLAAFSGRYNLTEKVEGFRDLFDGHYEETIYYHTPLHFLRGLGDSIQLQAIREMDIILAVGHEDPFFHQNEVLCQILREKGAKPSLLYWEGRAHQGRYWRKMAPLYL